MSLRSPHMPQLKQIGPSSYPSKLDMAQSHGAIPQGVSDVHTCSHSPIKPHLVVAGAAILLQAERARDRIESWLTSAFSQKKKKRVSQKEISLTAMLCWVIEGIKQGSLHCTEHCLVNGGFPFISVEKAMFHMGRMYLLRSPVKQLGLCHSLPLPQKGSHSQELSILPWVKSQIVPSEHPNPH